MHIHRGALLLLALSLGAICAGCYKPAPTQAPAPSVAAADAVVDTQADAAAVAVPMVVAVRNIVDEAAPASAAIPCEVDPQAVALIVRYEVTSEAYYTAHLLMPIWPGEQSGVTWGIGYDGGTQTRARIAADWRRHAQAARLVETSGIVGTPARALIPRLADVRTPYPLAAEVFATAMLPTYCELAARTFRDGWQSLPMLAQGALVATLYNRGAGMLGDRRREMRALRDSCVPAGDVACIARELRSMSRLWVGTPIEVGMRLRYEATAALAERGARS